MGIPRVMRAKHDNGITCAVAPGGLAAYILAAFQSSLMT
jgi:hypothetical protein